MDNENTHTPVSREEVHSDDTPFVQASALETSAKKISKARVKKITPRARLSPIKKEKTSFFSKKNMLMFGGATLTCLVFLGLFFAVRLFSQKDSSANISAAIPRPTEIEEAKTMIPPKKEGGIYEINTVYYAFTLSTGKMIFAKIDADKGDVLLLKNVFEPEGDFGMNAKDITIVPRAKMPHEPLGLYILDKHSLVSAEPLKDTSRIVKAIESTK